MDSLAGPRFEAVAGPGASTSPNAVASALFNEAAADSKAMDSDARNNITTVTLPCVFRYDYSHLK